MNKKIKQIAILLGCSILLNSVSASALTITDVSNQKITMSDILSSENKLIYTSDVTPYYPEKSGLSTYATGDYPIYTRVQTHQSSSNGLKACSSKTGTYSSIASLALSFISGIPAMRISQIFSAVSLAVGSDQYAQAKTFHSYVSYTKEGQATITDRCYA